MARKLYVDENGNDVFGFDLELEVKTEGNGLKENEIEIIGSTANRDRDDEVIVAEGIKLKNYKKNPVILPAHDYTAPAIGKSISVKLVDGKLVFKLAFPEEGVYPLADLYRKLYKAGFMKASSIGFIPIKWYWGKGDKDPRRTFEEVELLELSLVSVPANPQALVTAKSINKAVEEGIITEEDIANAEKGATDNKGKTEDKKEEASDVRDFTEEQKEILGGIIEEKISTVLDNLVKQGVIKIEGNEGEHYSKFLFVDPVVKDPKDSTTIEETLTGKDILGAVKQGVEGSNDEV